jgi:hypothetical protein
MNKVHAWLRISLVNFLVAALLGAIMRFVFVKEIPGVDYTHVESAHWHMALFGWIYLCIYSFLVGTFLTPHIPHLKNYTLIFWCTQVVIIADILFNLALGYTMISIGLDISLLFLIGCFIYTFLSDLKKTPPSYSGTIIRFALFFLAFSFSGMVFKVPLEMLFSTKRSILYYLSTQFFLHFNYNGWFTFSLFSLFFRLLENKGIKFNRKKFVRFKWVMATCVFFTFFLSIYWGYPGHEPFLWIAAGSAFVQLGAVAYVSRDLLLIFKTLRIQLHPYSRWLFQLALYAYLIKLFLQAVIIIPHVAYLALTIRNYMIAYLHLMFLGVTTLFLLGYGIQKGYIRTAGIAGKLGVWCVGLGFILTELILVFQGTLLWLGVGFFPFYYPLLFLVTLLLPAGLFFLVYRNYHSSKIITA